jgi:ABC-type branched-subunit amino acid transport system ATPase component/ABC-type branched-subunit amino acid transport system permease subunit
VAVFLARLQSAVGTPNRQAKFSRRAATVVALVVVAFVLPLVITDNYSRNLLVLWCIYGVAALSLNVIMGLMGQFSFGHAALWGIGGYVSGRLSLQLGLTPWLTIPVASVAAALVGASVGAIALRKTRGLELAIVTLGFGSIAWILALRWQWFGGGMSGVSGIPPVTLFGFSLAGTFRFYYLALSVLLLVLLGLSIFQRSRFGRAVISVRENEPLAASIGISPFVYYVMAFTLASGLAGLSGALYAHYQGFLNPSMLSLPIMIMFLMMVLLGGTGQLLGPVLGAGLYVGVTAILSFNQELQLLFFGILVVAVVRFMPDGLSAVVLGLWRRLFGHGAEQMDAAPGSPPGWEPRLGSGRLADTAPIGGSVEANELSTQQPCLEVRNLCMTFGGLVAVDSLDLRVEPGEIAGLIGPNGSGKTTTINMMSGFLSPTSGEVLLWGRDVTGHPPHDLARHGLVRTFQLSNVFADLSVHSNVIHSCHLLHRRVDGWGHESAGAHAREILEFVGLWDRRRLQAGELSAGERRYLEVANALAADPRVLLLDEPASGLNAEETARLIELIRQVRDAGTTVVIVEHNMRVIMTVCDRIVVLDQGRFLAAGEPAAISRDERVVAAYLGRSGSAYTAE